MIEWGSFLLVAVVSLIAAGALVTAASFGLRLYDRGQRELVSSHASGRAAMTFARILFCLCALIVAFGVYLIVPAFH